MSAKEVHKTKDDIDAKMILQFAAEGKICNLFGHVWEITTETFPRERVCRLCNLKQKEYIDWKNI